MGIALLSNTVETMQRLLSSMVLVAFCLSLQGSVAEARNIKRVERAAGVAWKKKARQHRTATGNRRAGRTPKIGVDYSSVLRAPRLTKAQASVVVKHASKRLGVDFRLKWDSNSKSIWYDKGKPTTVPRGMVRQRGMTADGLALILAHETGHDRGKRKEADADYWAARHGLRKLWGRKGFTKKRALEAAYSVLTSQFSQPFNVKSRKRKIELHATGYPTVQSRWDLYKAGIDKRKKPKVGKRGKTGEIVMFSPREAARYLGVSSTWLKQKTGKKGGPVQVDFGGKQQYIKADLDRIKSR